VIYPYQEVCASPPHDGVEIGWDYELTGTTLKLYVLVRFADDSHLEQRNPVPENQEAESNRDDESRHESHRLLLVLVFEVSPCVPKNRNINRNYGDKLIMVSKSFLIWSEITDDVIYSCKSHTLIVFCYMNLLVTYLCFTFMCQLV
jgi:hypothetical protein